MTKWTSVIVICGLLSQSMPAWAQNTAPPADSTTPHADSAASTDSTNAAPAAPPPDVVLTRAGAMVRGTISEKDPEGDVTIETVSGTLRRFSMRDVTYAGPAEGMPKPPRAKPNSPAAEAHGTTVQPRIRVKAGEAPISLKAIPPGVTFHLKTGSANFTGTGAGWSGGGTHAVAVAGTTQAYSVICTAPCEAVLPTGTHRMALSLEGGAPVEDEESVTLNGPARVQGKYTSRYASRIAGAAAGAGGLLGGTVIFVAGPKGEDDGSTTLLLGTTVMVVGLVVWLALGFRSDVAEIDVKPGAAHPRKRAASPPSTTGIRLSPSGLMF